MNDLTLSFEEAVRVLEFKDRQYMTDIQTLIGLLRKRRLDERENLHERGTVTISKSDHIADLYEKQAIGRAKYFILRAAMDGILNAKREDSL